MTIGQPERATQHRVIALLSRSALGREEWVEYTELSI